MDPYLESLPRKRVGAGVLLLNPIGEMLLVEPVYKPHWSIPGGVVDADESPWKACQREVFEEIGLELASLKLLCVSWTFTPSKRESLQFLFDGGELSPQDCMAVLPNPKELQAAEFLAPQQALPKLAEPLRSRVWHGLMAQKSGNTVYLEQVQSPQGWITKEVN